MILHTSKETTARALVLAAALGLLAVAAVAACLDLTTVGPDDILKPPPPAPFDAGVVLDAAALGDATLDVDPRPPCLRCMQTPDDAGAGCDTEFEACQLDPECHQSFVCALANGCLSVQTRQQLLACATPCILDSGISTQSSGGGKLVVALASCMVNGCGAYCAPGEAGTD